MKKTQISKVYQSAAFAAIAFLLLMMPLNGAVSAAQPNFVPPGYIDMPYDDPDPLVDPFVKAEPTADNPESKLWYNDGFWWGILFDQVEKEYAIYRLNWATQAWVKTATAVDSRIDTAETGEGVATRFDALWDGASGKLYLLSHLLTQNPANTNNADNQAQLVRYSYNAGSDTYTADTGFPIIVSPARTSAMVLDKDSTGRLWLTYVARPASGQAYRVYVNYTPTANNDLVWSGPIDISAHSSTATVTQDDESSVIAYGNKVGLMWSNQSDTNFYFAEIDAGDNPAVAANWDIDPILAASLNADDHIKLVANGEGEVFAAVKAASNGTYLITRSTTGTFTSHIFSPGDTDTHPTLAYNEDTDTIYMFVASNPTGGVICVNSAVVPANPGDLVLSQKNCDPTAATTADHFIADDTHTMINNPTTTKRPFTNASGLVVLASDDEDKVYLHGVIEPGDDPGPDPQPEKLYLPIIRRN